MLKTLLRSVVALTVVIAAILAAAYVTMMEQRFPPGTTTSVLVNLAAAQAPKAEVIEALDSSADATGESFVLIKADPDDTEHGVVLVVFGHVGDAGADGNWFAPDIHARTMASSEIGTESLSGYYAFASEAAADTFIQTVTRLGGTVDGVQTQPALLSRTVFAQNPGNGIAFGASLILLVSLAFAWATSRSRAQQMRILAGVSRPRIIWQDVCEVAWTAVPPALAAWALISVVAALWRGHAAGAFLFETAAMTLGIVMLLTVTTLLCSTALLPSVRRIGTRQPAFAAVRGINDVLKFGSLMLLLVFLPFATANALTASALANSAASWAEAKHAVALNTTLAGDGSQDDEYLPHIDIMLQDLDHAGKLALSYPVGSILSSSDQFIRPSDEQIAAVHGGHDEIFVTNPAFLSLMAVDASQLDAVAPDQLPAATREELEGSDEIWLQPGQRSLSERVFTWNGDEVFPALGAVDGSGRRATAANPLIVVVDDVSLAMKTSDFLFPALTSGNLLVSDAETAQRALVSHNLTDAFPSLSTIADTTLTNAQYASRVAQMSALGAMVLLVTIVICAAQSVRTWAAQHRRRIFLAHTAGRSYLSISSRRLAGELAFTVALTAAVWLLFGASQPTSAGVTVFIGAAVFVATEVLLYQVFTRRAFRLTVTRRV